MFLELSPHPLLNQSIEETLQHSRHAGVALASLRRDADEAESLYASAGALYRLGQSIEWGQMYVGGRLVELPTYAWRRERFWIAADTPQPGRRAQTKVLTASLGGDELPGRRLNSPLKEIQFELRLRGDTPSYLGDHRLNEAVVVPGAWYAAGWRPLNGCLALDHIYWKRSSSRMPWC